MNNKKYVEYVFEFFTCKVFGVKYKYFISVFKILLITYLLVRLV